MHHEGRLFQIDLEPRPLYLTAHQGRSHPWPVIRFPFGHYLDHCDYLTIVTAPFASLSLPWPVRRTYLLLDLPSPPASAIGCKTHLPCMA